MLKERECKEFLGKNVAVGVPHPREDRPFYFYGKLTDVRKDALVLRFPNGFKEVQLEEVIEIHLNDRGGY